MVTADAGLGGARRDPRPGDPGHLARRPRRHPSVDVGRRRPRPGRVHADVPRLPRARGDEARARGEASRRSAPSRTSQVIQDDSWSTDRITPAGREKLREAGFAPPAPRERRRRRRSSSCSRRRSAARTAARPRRGSRTSSARRRAARSATARAAASRSSSSRRSRTKSSRDSARYFRRRALQAGGFCKSDLRPACVSSIVRPSTRTPDADEAHRHPNA